MAMARLPSGEELAAVEKRENYLPTQAVGQRDSKLD